jgi:hypothetical protein
LKDLHAIPLWMLRLAARIRRTYIKTVHFYTALSDLLLREDLNMTGHVES